MSLAVSPDFWLLDSIFPIYNLKSAILNYLDFLPSNDKIPFNDKG